MAPVRTLLVDDHADVRFLIRAIMEDAEEDVEVVAEADGVESALAQLDEVAPDVVVMDALMPRVDGFEAAPLLLARRPGVALVLCTGLVDDDVRRRAADAGIATVMSKDEFDDLPAAIVRAARPRGRSTRRCTIRRSPADNPAMTSSRSGSADAARAARAHRGAARRASRLGAARGGRRRAGRRARAARPPRCSTTACWSARPSSASRRALLHAPERTAWSVMGAGMLAYALGNVVWSLVYAGVPRRRIPPRRTRCGSSSTRPPTWP